MFALIALMTAAMLFLDKPSLRSAILLGLLVWASCRFYYFLFYVLEHYVDSSMRYAGIFDLLSGMRARRRRLSNKRP